MKLCINWLPLSLDMTRRVAQRAEQIGLWGIGIGDSPKYGELYSACDTALSYTTDLCVTTGVTNPVTRHWSIHAAASRGFNDAYPGRFRLGMGRGDSAVHTHGLRPARLRDLEACLGEIVEHAPGTTTLVAASGPAGARMAGRAADGIIAGVGADESAIGMIRDEAASQRAGRRPAEIWATLRLAIGRDDAEVMELRRRMTPRAISASHFAFASTYEGKNVPAKFHGVLAERYAAYDYATHGRSGATSNAQLFVDRPDIESYLLDRFAIVGTVADCVSRLRDVSAYADGVFLSIVFEDALAQLAALGDVVDGCAE